MTNSGEPPWSAAVSRGNAIADRHQPRWTVRFVIDDLD
jgi:hypothetical protein